MAKTKVLFVSDLHLNSRKRYSDTRFPCSYRPDEHTPRLESFFKAYLSENEQNLKDVVLLGDVFDTWACPAGVIPQTLGEIVESNEEVLSVFRGIIEKGIRLLFVAGNHDSDASPSRIKELLPGIIIAKHYLNGRIYAVHGNEFDIFNAPDYVTDPGNGRPIGYFITRLSNTIPGGADALRNLPAYLDDLLEAALTPQNLFSSIIEALAEKAGLSSEDEIKLPGDKAVSIRELKERYEVLDEYYTFDEVVNNIYQRRYLDVPADRLCHEGQYKVVVFGHTHQEMLDKDWLFVEDRIYANCGSWCGENAYCVEIDHRPGTSSKTKVKLFKVKSDGSYRAEGKESI